MNNPESQQNRHNQNRKHCGALKGTKMAYALVGAVLGAVLTRNNPLWGAPRIHGELRLGPPFSEPPHGGLAQRRLKRIWADCGPQIVRTYHRGTPVSRNWGHMRRMPKSICLLRPSIRLHQSTQVVNSARAICSVGLGNDAD
jgi:hypothetical protein